MGPWTARQRRGTVLDGLGVLNGFAILSAERAYSTATGIVQSVSHYQPWIKCIVCGHRRLRYTSPSGSVSEERLVEFLGTYRACSYPHEAYAMDFVSTRQATTNDSTAHRHAKPCSKRKQRASVLASKPTTAPYWSISLFLDTMVYSDPLVCGFFDDHGLLDPKQSSAPISPDIAC